MKSLIVIFTLSLAGCISLPERGQLYSQKSFAPLTEEQSRLIIYSGESILNNYNPVNLQGYSLAYVLPQSFQEVVVENGPQTFSLPTFPLGLGAALTGFPGHTFVFYTTPSTNHYFRFERQREQVVQECQEDRDTIRVCSSYHDIPRLIEVQEEEARSEILNYQEVFNAQP